MKKREIGDLIGALSGKVSRLDTALEQLSAELTLARGDVLGFQEQFNAFERQVRAHLTDLTKNVCCLHGIVAIRSEGPWSIRSEPPHLSSDRETAAAVPPVPSPSAQSERAVAGH